jgi:hypothetical protein
MCPACIASAAWVVAGSASAGGLTAFVVKKLRPPRGTPASRPVPKTQESEESSP